MCHIQVSGFYRNLTISKAMACIKEMPFYALKCTQEHLIWSSQECHNCEQKCILNIPFCKIEKKAPCHIGQNQYYYKISFLPNTKFIFENSIYK